MRLKAQLPIQNAASGVCRAVAAARAHQHPSESGACRPACGNGAAWGRESGRSELPIVWQTSHSLQCTGWAAGMLGDGSCWPPSLLIRSHTATCRPCDASTLNYVPAVLAGAVACCSSGPPRPPGAQCARTLWLWGTSCQRQSSGGWGHEILTSCDHVAVCAAALWGIFGQVVYGQQLHGAGWMLTFILSNLCAVRLQVL